MNKNELEKLFHQYGVFDAAQFIVSARECIINACYYKDIVNALNDKIKDDNDTWRQNITTVPLDDNPSIQKILFDKRPDFNIDIAGVSVSMFYLQHMLIKAFFQECRNSLDIISQAANAACLAFKAKKIEKVDFGKMKDTFHQQTYSQTFPDICKWFDDIYNSTEYLYVDNYCNRAKHTCSVQTKYQLPIIGEATQSTILPFFRIDSDSTKQHNKQEVDSFITQTYNFFSKAYSDFVTIIKQEITKKTYVGDRYYTLSVYQQKFKSDSNGGFSMAYIDCETDITSMPDEIQVLFVKELQVNETESKIFAKNCPFDIIYIKNSSSETDYNYIGKYIAEDKTGEDELYRFRKYKKIVPEIDNANLFFDAMLDEKQKGVFYHQNYFVRIITNSDDEDFLQRTMLPF